MAEEMNFKSTPAEVAQGLVNLDQKGGNTNLSVARRSFLPECSRDLSPGNLSQDGLVKSRELFLEQHRKACCKMTIQIMLLSQGVAA